MPKPQSIDLVELSRLSSLPVHVAVLDGQGVIVEVNEAWRRFARQNGLAAPNDGVGLSYIVGGRYLDEEAGRVAVELGRLLRGEIGLLTYAYSCHGPENYLWFVLIGVPLLTGNSRGAVMLHVDLSLLLRSDGVLRHLGMPVPDIVHSALGTALSERGIVAAIEHTLERTIPLLLSGLSPRKAEAADPGRESRDRLRKALTPRQFEVFGLLGEGRTNHEIAERLSASPHTIRLHVAAILRRLELPNRAQAVAMAARLADPP